MGLLGWSTAGHQGKLRMRSLASLTAAIASGFMLGLAALPSTAAEIRGKGDKCIDIPNGDTKDGTKIHLWPCDGSPEQQWAASDGEIRGKDGKCLDIPDGDTRDGTKVHIWHCDGSAEQKWQYVSGALIGKGGKCLDLPGGSTKDGTLIQLWPCDGSEEQTWRVVAKRK